MKYNIITLSLLMILFQVEYIYGQEIDTTEYNNLIGLISEKDTAYLSDVSQDTSTLNEILKEIVWYDEQIMNAPSKSAKDKAKKDNQSKKNEFNKKFKSFSNDWNKYFRPVEFKDPAFQAIENKLNEIDLDNKFAIALKDIETKILKREEELRQQISKSDNRSPLLDILKNNIILWLLPLMLLLGLISTAIGYLLKSSKFNKFKLSNQNDNLLKDNKIYSLQKEIDHLKMNSTNIQPNELQEKKSFSHSIIPPNTMPSFFAESFVSAGPRKLYTNDKGEGDIDLGEDIAGFLVGGNYSAFWVLDGTSGQDKLSTKDDRINLGERNEEYFSSRLLAQNIAWNLHSLIKKYGFTNSSFKLLKEAIKLTELDWQSKIESLSEVDSNELKNLLQERNMLICSTTIAFGILGMNRELDLTISGDCVVATHPNQIDLDKNNRRQSANLYLENGKIKIDFNEIKKDNCIVITESNIDKVVAMSDGISKTTQKWISTNANIDFTNPKIREGLARLKQKTQDDKSITIIQIL